LLFGSLADIGDLGLEAFEGVAVHTTSVLVLA
jgi:hypothetical protein